MKKIILRLNKQAKLLLMACLLCTSVWGKGDDTGLKPTAEAFMKNAPIGFTQNKGQLKDQHGKANAAVKYMLNMPGLKVELRNAGFSYDTWAPRAGGLPESATFHRVDIDLVGARIDAPLVAEDALADITNVVKGNETISGIHSFYKVTYKDIYPGIDLEFIAKKGAGKPVEYNFIVHPGADASLIKMRYKGANSLALKQDRIAIKLNNGTLEESIPASWVQQTGENLDVHYKELGNGLYAFDLPDYNRMQTLVIDPTPNLEWATLYGGSGSDIIYGVDADADGNIYAIGSTASNDIASSGAYDGTLGGSRDVLIAKFNSAGQRLWATYYGGGGSETGIAITFHNGELYIGGYTGSNNANDSGSVGMATPGAFQEELMDTLSQNKQGGFLARFDAATGTRNWGTYYGGVRNIAFSKIIVDAQGNFYAYGMTKTTLFPLSGLNPGNIPTPGTFRPEITTGSGTQSVGALVKFNNANERQWGTFAINCGLAMLDAGLAFGPDGNIYVAGTSAGAGTDSLAANTVEGQVPAGATEGAILEINKEDGTRIWGRYYGGTGNDRIAGIVCDGSYLYVAGLTVSASGIATPGSAHPNLVASTDGFLAKFTLNGERVFGTYLGSASGATTWVTGIRMGMADNIDIIGYTNNSGTELASNCTYQPVPGGGNDFFLNRFSSTGERLWGTYFGVPGNETFIGGTSYDNFKYNSFITDSQGNVIIGAAVTDNGLVTPNAYQAAYGGGANDGLLAKFNSGAVLPQVTVTPSSLSPASQTACILGIPEVITGNTVTVTGPAGYSGTVYYQWQVADDTTGTWTDMIGEVNKNLQPLAAQSNKYYRRLVTLNSDYCNKTAVDTSSAVSVLVNGNVAPIAAADGPQWYVCNSPDNIVTLNGSATGGTPPYSYEWFAGSLDTAVETQATYAPASASATTYTLRVTDAAGCSDLDQATIVPVPADAGPDKSICQGSGGVQIGATPIASPNISYSWSAVSGDPVSTLSCTNCAQPIANPATATTYQLTVSVLQKDGSTCTTTDEVTVTPVTAPDPATFAGTDMTICRGSSMALGVANADSTFAYTWSPGLYLSDATTANPVFNSGSTAIDCSVNYMVTALKAGCTFTDEVEIAAINQDIDHENDSTCGPTWINGKFSNCAEATYSWSVVSGSGSVLQTSNGGANAYLTSPGGSTVFRRTTTLNGASCTADITVNNACGNGCNFEIDTITALGCPKIFTPGSSFKLSAAGVDTSSYSISWSPAGMVDNPTARTVTITSDIHTTITCTITNNYDPSISCSKSVEVNSPSWSVPSFTADDQNICYNTATPIGIPAVAGYTYNWSPAAGLDDAGISNPMATLTASRNYALTITEAASGCHSVDTVHVSAIPVVAIAGTDHAVCNGATITLGSAPPSGTSFTYSWTPVDAAWTNGTGPDDAQPQVVFASSSQDFTLTVTDPQSGCTSSDTVTLSGTVSAGEYAGAGDTVCAGATVQLGTPEMPFANYDWTLADDSPASGLSCTTCANPILTAPDTTTTYKVKVSYPGCTQPTEDLVTIVVKPAPAVTLADQGYCPASPVAIGFGATGNPSDTADIASYAWAPATGLSCTDCSNPTTTVQVATGYEVKVTYANGCEQKDSVIVTPTIVVDAGPDVAICSGETTTIGTPAEGGLTYSWSGGSFSGVSDVAQPTVNPTATTTYTVSVSNGSCTSSDQVLVTVNNPADFNITGNTAICAGGLAALGLSAAPAANTSWQWSPLNGVTDPNNPNTTIAADSTQIYRLTQTNMATGCSNYKEVLVTVSPNSIAAATTDTAVCAGTTLSLPLTVTPAGDYQYVWTPAVGLSNAYEANPTVTANVDRNYAVSVTDNVTHCQLLDTVSITIKPEEECLPPVMLSGNVFHDANGLKDATVNNTSALPIPSGLYVSLIKGSSIMNTVPVNADGTFDFGATDPGSYSIVLHQNPAGATSPGLPSGWKNMGEELNAGVGNDGAADGVLTGITLLVSNVTDANFGIQQPPVSDAKSYTIDPPAEDQNITLDGSYVSTGSDTTAPGQLTGTDPEDDLLDGTSNNRSLVIVSLPEFGELWYNGAPVTTGQLIANYNASLLVFKATGTGYNSAGFQYAYRDEAGLESAPVSYLIQWGIPLPVTLLYFNAEKDGKQALLQWKTVREANSDYFLVERSADSKNWQSIARVNAAGNSNINQKYEARDAAPLEGINFYRLRMVSLDGNYELSAIHPLEFDSYAGNIQVVPNPAILSAKLLFPTSYKVPVEVGLLNMLGQKVRNYTLAAGSKECLIDLSGLAKGMYTLSIENTGSKKNIKLIVN